jgi:AraC family transcriptional regulator
VNRTPPTDGDLAERLGEALDYLEATLSRHPSLDEAARRAGFSRWHFMRLFQAAIGMPVAEYVRRRRLSRAAEALAAGQPVLAAAIDWGYETQAAFTRAFSRAFGVTPGAFARRARAGKGREGIALVLRAEPRLPFPAAPPPVPRLERRAAFRAVGLGTRAPTRRFQSFVDIPAFWDDWLRHERWRAIRGAAPGAPHLALLREHASGELEYVIALEVAPGTRPPHGYRAVEVPACRYAMFSADGPPTVTAQSLALSGFGLWLPASGERLRHDGWELELYAQVPGLPPGHLRCEVGIPLVG